MKLYTFTLRVTKTFDVIAETEDLATEYAHDQEKLHRIDDGDDAIEVLNIAPAPTPEHDE